MLIWQNVININLQKPVTKFSTKKIHVPIVANFQALLQLN